MECLLVADDLTGACDAAVHFAAAGLRVFVPLTPDSAPREAQALGYSTESRDIDPAEAVRRVRQLAGRPRAQEPRILYKKIDSTLRGNTGVEIVAAREAFGCEAAVVNPAFPAMGRIVQRGSLQVPRDPGFQPIELGGWLRASGAETCVHAAAGSLGAAIDSGAKFVSCDAVCQADLEALAAEVLALGRRILWAGSAGLAGALARRLGHEGGARHSPIPGRGPVLFCIGSDHPVTVEQQRRLTLARGQHFVFSIPRDTAADQLQRGFPACRPAALFVCGGDTASLVCAALGARSIELRREFAPGIPEGILHGGAWDGVPVLTKSGGFGAPDDLIRIADYFHG
jgi:uncharacterized protein YgbK (DUF1537 family)